MDLIQHTRPGLEDASGGIGAWAAREPASLLTSSGRGTGAPRKRGGRRAGMTGRARRAPNLARRPEKMYTNRRSRTLSTSP